jgi:hypothetical protein
MKPKLIREVEHEEVMTIIGKPKPTKKVKKAKNPPIDRRQVLYNKFGGYLSWGNPFCECGCDKAGSDLHHCFIHRMKGYPVLDDERNLVYVNHDEHISRKFDNKEWRVYFWQIQCRRYGENKMLEWIEQVKAAGIHPSRIDWL